MDQISRLTGRAGQSTLGTATPSSPGNDGDAHFRYRAQQGCKKKLTRIKLLVNDIFREKTLSIIQTNYIIKAVKDKKCQNDEKDRQRRGCHCRCCILSPVAKLSMQFPSRRLWLCHSQFSS
jgi:hypothetical protein